jgi:cytoskeletal protein RodZ
MQLNELFEQYAIETIEAKTNIPKEKLADLKEGDWSKFKRAQALGFLNIFEREFGVDLNEVKDECRSFFEQQQPLNSSAKIDFIDSQVAKSSNGGVVSKVIAVVTLAALGYAGWYYYNKSYQNSATIEQNSTQSGINLQSNNQTEPAKVAVEQNSTKEQDKKENNTQPKIEQNITKEPQTSANQKFDIVTSNTQSSNETTVEQKVVEAKPNKTKSIKDEVETLLNEANGSAKNKESNSSSEANLTLASQSNSTNTQLEQNTTEQSATTQEQPVSNILAETNSANSSTADENSINSSSIEESGNTQNQESANENSSAQVEDVAQEDSSTLAEPLNSVKVVVKSKRLWIGIYNLDSGKKVSKIIKKGTTLDLTNGKLAIITGHSRLNLVTNNETKEFKSKGRMFLLLSQNEGIKVITKKEYKELTKNRAW